jgi:hypothetical protein
MQRFKWDPKLSRLLDYCTIGHLDRFDGVLETSYTYIHTRTHINARTCTCTCTCTCHTHTTHTQRERESKKRRPHVQGLSHDRGGRRNPLPPHTLLQDLGPNRVGSRIATRPAHTRVRTADGAPMCVASSLCQQSLLLCACAVVLTTTADSFRTWEAAVAPYIMATLHEKPAIEYELSLARQQPGQQQRKKAVILSCGSFCPIHRQHVRGSVTIGEEREQLTDRLDCMRVC